MTSITKNNCRVSRPYRPKTDKTIYISLVLCTTVDQIIIIRKCARVKLIDFCFRHCIFRNCVILTSTQIYKLPFPGATCPDDARFDKIMKKLLGVVKTT